MLVHGEGEKMKFLRSKIRAEHGIDCYMPANGETAAIPGRTTVPARVSVSLLKKEAALYARQPPDAKRVRLLHGVMVLRADGSFTLEEPEAAAAQLGVTPHTVRFTTKVSRLGLPSVQVSLADSGEVEGVVARVVAAARGALEGGQAALTRGAEGDIKVESVIVQVGRVGFGMIKFVVMLFSYRF